MQFLGYVDVPKTLYEYSVGPRVIVTEWVQGRHLDKLTQIEGLRMTYMAVEAVTASLVVTGFVHADPHEGNLMLQVRSARTHTRLLTSVAPALCRVVSRHRLMRTCGWSEPAGWNQLVDR